MSKLTDFYGEFRCLFRGVGKLNDQECQFEIGQQNDGGIMLHCHSDDPSLGNDGKIELTGTVDGQLLHAKGKTIRNSRTGHFDHFYASAGTFELNIGDADWASASIVKFDITNFMFFGNEHLEDDHGRRISTLRMELDDVRLSFQHVDNYEFIEKSLKQDKDTQVTCQLSVEIGNQTQEKIFEVVDAVCSLLTVARGTKINWINYELIDAESNVLCHHFRPRITVPFAYIPLVKTVNAPEAIISYLNQSYATYKELNPHYHFDHIGNFLADIHSRGFLETRCLLLFSVAEVLARADNNSGKLLSRLRDFVDKHNVPVQKCQVKKCGRGCGSCEPKCKECKYRCEDDCEIGMFVKDRNGIVHKMRFPDDSITYGYYRNLHFLHRMILSALIYRGELYDWKEGGPIWA